MPRPSLVALRTAALLTIIGTAGLVTETVASAQPPTKSDVPELKLRWEVPPKGTLDFPLIQFDQDGAVLAVLSGRGGGGFQGVTFNARTGKSGPELKIADSLYGPTRFFAIDKSRFAIQANNTAEKGLIYWDSATGRTERTAPYPVVGTGFPTVHLSPDARFLTASETTVKDGKIVESPVKVFEMKTGKALVSSEWTMGHARFTADSARVVLVDGDRFQWFKLPSGQTDGDWKLDPTSPGRGHAQLLDMTSDGSQILCFGTARQGTGVHLVDGRTGAVLHTFPLATHHSHRGYLSPNGDAVVLHRTIITTTAPSSQSLEVYDSKGKMLGEVKLPEPIAPYRRTATTAISWQARAIAAYDPNSKVLQVFDLPAGVGGVAGAASALRPVGRDVEGAGRAPVPSDPAVGRAELAIRQVLKDEYARKGAADQKALAQKLLKMAEETADDVPARFVMLRDARDFAQAVADPTLALQAVEGLAKWYQVDGQGLQLAALEKILAATATQATAKAVADAAALAAQASTLADELDDAVQFAQVAAAAVRKAKATQAAVDEADVNLALARKARDSFAAIRQALDKLKATPDDPVANLQVGKYRCFVQNRWDEGLKHLAVGEDAALRAVAEVDLKAPRAGVPDDAKVADAWWEYAQSAPADFQWAAQARTRYWYGRCIPGLTGLNKARAETRLAVSVGGTEYRPGLLCEFAAKQPAVLKGKKARLDTALDFSSDEFADAGKQTDLTVKWTGALVPTRGGRYTLAARTTDQVRIRVDGKVVIDTSVAAGRRDAPVVLGERATPIVVEYFAPNVAGHRIKLVWVPPGAAEEEVIPAECLFHDKKLESSLGK